MFPFGITHSIDIAMICYYKIPFIVFALGNLENSIKFAEITLRFVQFHFSTWIQVTRSKYFSHTLCVTSSVESHCQWIISWLFRPGVITSVAWRLTRRAKNYVVAVLALQRLDEKGPISFLSRTTFFIFKAMSDLCECWTLPEEFLNEKQFRWKLLIILFTFSL